MIQIQVIGRPNSGKSSIMEVIRRALVEHGVDVTVEDYDGERVPPIEVTMPVIANRHMVKITQAQPPRNADEYKEYSV